TTVVRGVGESVSVMALGSLPSGLPSTANRPPLRQATGGGREHVAGGAGARRRGAARRAAEHPDPRAHPRRVAARGAPAAELARAGGRAGNLAVGGRAGVLAARGGGLAARPARVGHVRGLPRAATRRLAAGRRAGCRWAAGDARRRHAL